MNEPVRIEIPPERKAEIDAMFEKMIERDRRATAVVLTVAAIVGIVLFIGLFLD